MKRGEFYLENVGLMGVTSATNSNTTGNNNDLYDRKVNCAIKYQAILYKYFLVALRNETSQQIRNTVSSNV